MRLSTILVMCSLSTPALAGGPLLPLRCSVDEAEAAEAMERVSVADRALQTGNLKRAHKLYDEALALDPCSNHVWTRYGALLLEEGHPELARRALGRAIALDNSSARTWTLFAQSAEQLGQWDAATRSWSKALALHPGLAVAEEGLARAAAAPGDQSMVGSR